MAMLRNPLVFLLVWALPLGVTACTTNPATGGSMFNTLSAQDEAAIGQSTAEAELKRFGLVEENIPAVHYVANLCQRIWNTTEESQNPVSCLLTDSEQFNAWATPGYINVYRGLLPYVQSEAQLAAVMAHEAGHVTAHHVGQAYSKQVVFGSLAAAGAIAVAYSTNNDIASSLAYTAGGVAASAAVMSYGRKDELEADSLAQRYLARAGYPVTQVSVLLNNMAAHEQYDALVSSLVLPDAGQSDDGLVGSLFASHPNTDVRRQKSVQQAQATLSQPLASTMRYPADPTGVAAYHQALNGLPYGPRREDGIAGRGYLAYPSLKVVLALPDGLVMRHTEATEKNNLGLWRGAHPASGVRLSVRAVSATDGINPASLFQKLEPKVADLRQLPVNGRTATVGLVPGNQPVRLIGIPAPGKNSLIIAAYTYPSTATMQAEEPTLLRILAQSRFLDSAQAGQVRRLTIKTFTTTADLPVSLLASNLPQGALQEEWFRVLNGLSATDSVVPAGAWYKTVFDANDFLHRLTEIK